MKSSKIDVSFGYFVIILIVIAIGVFWAMGLVLTDVVDQVKIILS